MTQYMMSGAGMGHLMDWMMGLMGFSGGLVIILIVLVILALIKYLLGK